MLELGVKFLLSYLLGSLMGAMVMGRLYGGVDIRTMGSGNAGGTNALRTQGFVFALGVVIVDVGKGFVGAAIVPGLELPFVPTDPEISRTWLTLACAAAAVIGHVWPMYHGFRGGKGGATMLGTLLALGPVLILPVLIVWVWTLILSGFVGLATMLAALSVPAWIGGQVLLGNADWLASQPMFIYTLGIALYIVYCHRSNIQRMRDGSEHRNDKLMFFSRARQSSGDDAA